jgi:transposase-like protein
VKRRSKQERREIVEAYRRSGMTQEAFAKRHRLKVGTLRGWLYRQEEAAVQAPTGRFVEVQPAATARRAAVVLRVSESLVIECEDLPPPEYLASLAEALGC